MKWIALKMFFFLFSLNLKSLIWPTLESDWFHIWYVWWQCLCLFLIILQKLNINTILQGLPKKIKHWNYKPEQKSFRRSFEKQRRFLRWSFAIYSDDCAAALAPGSRVQVQGEGSTARPHASAVHSNTSAFALGFVY